MSSQKYYPTIEVNQLNLLLKPTTFINKKMILLCDHSKINSILRRTKMYKANMLCAFNTIQEILLDMPLLSNTKDLTDKRYKTNMVFYKSKKNIFTLQGFVKKIINTFNTSNKISHQHAFNSILYNICCFMKTASEYFVQFSKELKISLIESKPEIIEKIIVYVKDFINFENLVYERCGIEDNELYNALVKIISQIIFTFNNKFFISVDLIPKPLKENKEKIKIKKTENSSSINCQLERKIEKLAIATLGLPKSPKQKTSSIKEESEKKTEDKALQINLKQQGTSIQEDQLTARSSRLSQKSIYDFTINKPSTPIEIGDHDNGILIILPPSKNEFELDWNDNDHINHSEHSSHNLKITPEKYECRDLSPSEISINNKLEKPITKNEKETLNEKKIIPFHEENTKIQTNIYTNCIPNKNDSTKIKKNILETNHSEINKINLKGILSKELPYNYKRSNKLLGTIDIHSQPLTVDELWRDETIEKFIQLKIPFWKNQIPSPISEIDKKLFQKSKSERNWNSNWLLKEACRRRRKGEGVWSDWMIQLVLDEAVPEWRQQAMNSNSFLHTLLRNYLSTRPDSHINKISEELLNSNKNNKRKKTNDLELVDLFEAFTIKCVIEAIHNASKDIPSENKSKIINKLKIK